MTATSAIMHSKEPHKLKEQPNWRAMWKDFRTRPRTVWPLNRTPRSKSAKGYRRSQFEDVGVNIARARQHGPPRNIKNLRFTGNGTR